MGYHFSIGSNPFSGVCPFHFYGICNEQELASGCVTGKITQHSNLQLHQEIFNLNFGATGGPPNDSFANQWRYGYIWEYNPNWA